MRIRAHVHSGSGAAGDEYSGRGAAARDPYGHAVGLLHPCQSALAIRSARLADLDPGIPPLASHLPGAAESELRRHAAVAGSNLRDTLYAARGVAIAIRDRNQSSVLFRGAGAGSADARI